MTVTLLRCTVSIGELLQILLIHQGFFVGEGASATGRVPWYRASTRDGGNRNFTVLLQAFLTSGDDITVTIRMQLAPSSSMNNDF